MHLTGFDRLVWAASSLGQILILLVLLVRRRAREFPLFTLYMIAGMVSGVGALYVMSHYSFHAYQHFYWTIGLTDEVLQLLVLYEIATHVFCPTGVWARDVRKAFLVGSAVSIVLALLLTWLANPSAPKAIQTFILRSNFFSAALMSELFVGMVVLSGSVGLPWKTHVARIAQGFGVYSLVSVALDIVSNFVGLRQQTHTFTLLSRIGNSAWVVCEAYWCVMLWINAPASKELPEAMRIQIYTLQRQVENDLIRLRAWRKH